MKFNHSTDEWSGNFIDKNLILQYVTEEQIFELVFCYYPVEFKYVKSPFRKDSDPGCWFEYDTEGRLRFMDYANSDVINGIRMRNIGCFDAVQVYFKLPTFYDTLKFVYSNLIQTKPTIKKEEKDFFKNKKKPKLPTELKLETRPFRLSDKIFWDPYEITKEQLIEDVVFAVNRFAILNSKTGDYIIETPDLCYAYTDFKNTRKKIYRPTLESKGKFITNCIANDVGGINSLPKTGDNLIITKSYKDWRVLKNQGLIVIWFQNEGMFPSNEILKDLGKRFKKVTIFFDNDKAGEKASKALKEHLRDYELFKDIREIRIPYPKIKDPSDFIYEKGREELLWLLRTFKLLKYDESL